jgi:uncharacterized membrane protein
MDMQAECVIAAFADRERAQLGLEVLARSGYGEDHVSIITRQAAGEVDELESLEKSNVDTHGVPEGVGLGALLGTAVSVPLVVGSLVGPLFIFGPIVGAGLGAVLGGMLAGGTEKEDLMERYRQTLEQGGVLLIITGTRAELLEAKASIKTAGPTEVTRFSTTEGWSDREF